MITNIKDIALSYINKTINKIDTLWSINPKIFILSLILIALFLRLLFFVGFGLGDDPYYASTANNIGQSFQWPNLEFGSNQRYGLFLPLAIFIKLFGLNELSYIILPLISSLGMIIVLFLLGKELFDKKIGLIAACLITFSTFDIVFSSTMTIDIPVTFLLSTALLLFIYGLFDAKRFNIYLYFSLSAFLIFWSFLIKIPSAAIVFVFICISLINYKLFKKYYIFFLILFLLFSLFFTINYIFSGDFFYYIHKELQYGPKPIPDYKGSYLLWMFGNTYSGIKLFGYYFYFTIFSIIICLFRVKKHIFYLLIWFFALFLIMCFMPVTLHRPFMFLPRFFRYTYMFLPPAILLSSVALKIIKNKNKILFYFIMIFLISSSLFYSYRLSHLYSSHYNDRKIAAKFLDKSIPLPIYSDNSMLDAFNFYSKYKKIYLYKFNFGNKLFQRDIVEKKDFIPLSKIKNSYIVVGGSRGPDMGMFAVFNLNKYPIPSNWSLLMEVPSKLDEYRYEPLRIYLAK